jgi:hypothetical protein
MRQAAKSYWCRADPGSIPSLVALTMGTMEYQRNVRGLGPGYAGRASWRPMLFAGLIAVLGLLASIVMLLRQ